MELTEKSASLGRLIANAVIAAIAAALASTGVLLLLGIEMEPAIVAAVVGAVAGSLAPSFFRRKAKE